MCTPPQEHSHLSCQAWPAGGPALLADFRWHRFSRLLDIGGAHGSFLAALLRLNPKATGVLFDQPEVRVVPQGQQLCMSSPWLKLSLHC